MRITVTEYNRGDNAYSETIDETRFVELYGEKDLELLKKNGKVGDVIGQGRHYYAELPPTPPANEDSGIMLGPI